MSLFDNIIEGRHPFKYEVEAIIIMNLKNNCTTSVDDILTRVIKELEVP